MPQPSCREGQPGVRFPSPEGEKPGSNLLADSHADLIIAKGEAHEVACLAALRAEHGDVVKIPYQESREERQRLTLAAMDRGVPVIHQAALVEGDWIGYADFLVRVEEPCPSWTWSYEPWDAKLARSARPDSVSSVRLGLARQLGQPFGRAHALMGSASSLS